MNKDKVLQYINSHNLIEIKAGQERTTFLEIWMVTVNNRILPDHGGLQKEAGTILF
jgi:hypothetical protein